MTFVGAEASPDVLRGAIAGIIDLRFLARKATTTSVLVPGAFAPNAGMPSA